MDGWRLKWENVVTDIIIRLLWLDVAWSWLSMIAMNVNKYFTLYRLGDCRQQQQQLPLASDGWLRCISQLHNMPAIKSSRVIDWREELNWLRVVEHTVVVAGAVELNWKEQQQQQSSRRRWFCRLLMCDVMWGFYEWTAAASVVEKRQLIALLYPLFW